MLILKVFLLQCFWLAIVLFGTSINNILPIVASICICGINYLIFNPKISVGRFFLSYLYSPFLDIFTIHR